MHKAPTLKPVDHHDQFQLHSNGRKQLREPEGEDTESSEKQSAVCLTATTLLLGPLLFKLELKLISLLTIGRLLSPTESHVPKSPIFFLASLCLAVTSMNPEHATNNSQIIFVCRIKTASAPNCRNNQPTNKKEARLEKN